MNVKITSILFTGLFVCTSFVNAQQIYTNGPIATGTVSTDLPATSQALNLYASRCMSVTSVTNTGQFDLMKLGVFSQL